MPSTCASRSVSGTPAHSNWSLAQRDDNAKYFELWRTRYLAESDRAIEQVAPERRRSLPARARERLERDKRERSLPAHKSRKNLHNFRDAQDAVALFEPAVEEFGYSLLDVAQTP